MRKSRFAAAALALSLATAGAVVPTTRPARAAGADAAALAQAKTLFDAGAQAYEAGHFGAAVQAFAQAYALAPRPAILFSMAQAERKAWYVYKHAADLQHALEHYHAYLAQVPRGGRGGDAADAVAELEAAAARMGVPSGAGAGAGVAVAATRMMVTCATSGAMASLDGGPPAEVPLIEDVAPGKHHVKVWADGYFDEERDAIAAGGSLAAIDVPLREKPAMLSLAIDTGAAVSVDGRPMATTPLVRPLELAAGTHFVAVTKSGCKAFTREVTLARGQQTTLPVRLETSGQRTAAWIVLGTAGAAAVGGAVFTTLALVEQSKAHSVLEAQASGNVSEAQRQAYTSEAAARDRWRTAAVASFGGAVALAVIGGALHLFDRPNVEAAALPAETPRGKPQPDRKKSDTMEMSAAPWLAPGGAGLAFGGRWW